MLALSLAAGLACVVEVVRADDANAAKSTLKVELLDAPLSVKFTNTGGELVRILKPLDGSDRCWMMPHYKLTVIDELDHEAPPQTGRCKLFGEPYIGTKWPEDYLVSLPPGGSYSQPILMTQLIRKAGPHRLRFEYVFDPSGKKNVGGRPYPDGLWRGIARSETIETRLEATPTPPGVSP